jgi:hypothetical protein
VLNLLKSEACFNTIEGIADGPEGDGVQERERVQSRSRPEQLFVRGSYEHR